MNLAGEVTAYGLTIVLALWLSVTLLAAAARADDFGLTPRGMFDGLPAGFVNVSRPEFGHNLIIPGDYGLGNIVKVEDWHRGPRHQVRLFRTPELRVSHTRPAKMEVLAGNVKMLYVWIETPPIQGSWHLTPKEELNSEVQIILSRPVLERVVRELHLDHPRPVKEAGVAGILGRLLKIPEDVERFLHRPVFASIPEL